MRRIADDQGLLPEVVWAGSALRIVVHNCAFRELSDGEPDLVCAMHRAFLQGVLEVVTTHLGELHIDPGDGRIACGAGRCEMTCSFTTPNSKARRAR